MSAIESYNHVAYSSMPVRETDPLHLATVAALFGLDAADPRTCDVLELGCGDGGNLMSLATAYPGIRGVGYDPAAGAIERGREVLARIGLQNLTLEHEAAAIAAGGTADYVMAHGVLSWVGAEAVPGVIADAAHALRPGGLASFSYRVYPYAHYELPAREMAKRAIADAVAEAAARGETLTWTEQVHVGRERLKLVASIPSTEPHAHAMKLMEEKWSRTADWFLFHDDLAGPPLTPYTSTEIAGLAAARGLQYVGELVEHELWQYRYPADFCANVRELGGEDAVRCRQLVDDLGGINFHTALFVKADEPPEFEPALRGRDLWVRKYLPGTAKGEINSDKISPGVAQVLRERDPEAVLVSEIAEDLGRDPAEVERDVLKLYAYGLARISTVPPPVPAPPGDHPRATPLILEQIRSGQPFVSSRFHYTVGLEPSAKAVAWSLADGTRSAKAIRRELPAAAATAGLTADLDATIAKLDQVLEEAALSGLLVAPAA